MKDEYGSDKGKQVFYASVNKKKKNKGLDVGPSVKNKKKNNLPVD